MVVGIDFCKFLRVTRVDGLPLVPMDGDESGRRWSGFSEAKRPTQGITAGELVAADLGWTTAGRG